MRLLILILLFSVGLVSAKTDCPVYSDSFIQYIKLSENGIRSGWNGHLWFPHKSVEGGSDTIAYGHKIQVGKDFSAGLTESQALDKLHKDLMIAESRAKNYIEKNHGVKWSELDTWQHEIFIDFQFNGVLHSFPNFRRAVIDRNLAGMRAEYKRSAKTADGIRIELKDRNTRFYNRYLGDSNGFQ